MTTATYPQLRPAPYPALPLGPFRRDEKGEIVRFATEGTRVIKFIEKHCVFSNGQWIGQPFRLLDWQKQLLLDLFELTYCNTHDRLCRRHRTALIGVGKKNGKSEIAAALALYFLIGDGEKAPLVPCAAAGDDQADIVFGAASTMASMSPTLAPLVSVFEDRIIVPEKPGAVLRRLPASGGRLDGKNVYAAVCDELHEWTTGTNSEKTWGMMRGGMAARAHPMNINITTAGFDQESVCYRLYDYGRKVESGEIDDPTMFFRWWTAPDGCDYRDPEVWPLANPSYGVTVQAAFYTDEISKRRESEFRRYYLNQWVETEETWLHYGAWEACEVPCLELLDGAKTWIGWDASSKRDSTALVMVQKAGERLCVKAHIWERPTGPDGRPVEDWHVPRNEIIDFLRTAWRSRYKVRGIAFDPAFITWVSEDLANEGLPMFEWFQTDTRMVPATEGAYQAIIAGEVEHDGNPTLTRHIRNAVAVSTSRGGHRLRKPRPGSPKYIDGAIALLMAVDLAQRDNETERPVLPIGYGSDEEMEDFGRKPEFSDFRRTVF